MAEYHSPAHPFQEQPQQYGQAGGQYMLQQHQGQTDTATTMRMMHPIHNMNTSSPLTPQSVHIRRIPSSSQMAYANSPQLPSMGYSSSVQQEQQQAMSQHHPIIQSSSPITVGGFQPGHYQSEDTGRAARDLPTRGFPQTAGMGSLQAQPHHPQQQVRAAGLQQGYSMQQPQVYRPQPPGYTTTGQQVRYAYMQRPVMQNPRERQNEGVYGQHPAAISGQQGQQHTYTSTGVHPLPTHSIVVQQQAPSYQQMPESQQPMTYAVQQQPPRLAYVSQAQASVPISSQITTQQSSTAPTSTYYVSTGRAVAAAYPVEHHPFGSTPPSAMADSLHIQSAPSQEETPAPIRQGPPATTTTTSKSKASGGKGKGKGKEGRVQPKLSAERQPSSAEPSGIPLELLSREELNMVVKDVDQNATLEDEVTGTMLDIVDDFVNGLLDASIQACQHRGAASTGGLEAKDVIFILQQRYNATLPPGSSQLSNTQTSFSNNSSTAKLMAGGKKL